VREKEKEEEKIRRKRRNLRRVGEENQERGV